MNRSALRNMLKVVGIIMVVMLPVMLALWFAQLRAVSEISAQLRTFMLKARRFSARPFLRRIILTPSPLPITHVNPTLLSIIFAIRHFLMVIK